MHEVFGNIHSIETCGTVDGPGIRFVVFLQGCPLRCKFCHNPDTWNLNSNNKISASELFEEIKKYRSYMEFSNGGVTFSGGEPFLQPDFIEAVVKLCKPAGIHVAIDTSGFILTPTIKKILKDIDLVLLDIKHFDPSSYRAVTGVDLQPTLNFLHYLNKIQKPFWLRYVLVPNLTDDLPTIEALAKYLQDYPSLERIDILPFHKLGESKWEELGLDYTLYETPEPSEKLKAQVYTIFSEYHNNVFIS